MNEAELTELLPQAGIHGAEVGSAIGQPLVLVSRLELGVAFDQREFRGKSKDELLALIATRWAAEMISRINTLRVYKRVREETE